jgi:hypothetical protein
MSKSLDGDLRNLVIELTEDLSTAISVSFITPKIRDIIEKWKIRGIELYEEKPLNLEGEKGSLGPDDSGLIN